MRRLLSVLAACVIFALPVGGQEMPPPDTMVMNALQVSLTDCEAPIEISSSEETTIRRAAVLQGSCVAFQMDLVQEYIDSLKECVRSKGADDCQRRVEIEERMLLKAFLRRQRTLP